jgi:TolB protein
LEGSLAFSATVEDNVDIYLIPDMHAINPELVRLTLDPANDYDPALSPDGETLAFISNRSGHEDLYLMQIQTGSIQNLTNTPTAAEFGPAWSPDGRRLAYMSTGGRSLEVFVMNADGNGVRQLTDNLGMDRNPEWSPDGTQIAFSSEMDGRDLEIYVMNADGSDPRQLTHAAGADDDPSWSADGSEIVYVQNASSSLEHLAILNLEEAAASEGLSGSRPLTSGPQDFEPAWHGQFIAYSTIEAGHWYIRVVDTDGVEVKRIEVFSAESNRGPTWASTTIQVALAQPTASASLRQPSPTAGASTTPAAARSSTPQPSRTSSPARTPLPSVGTLDGRLVFLSNRDGNNELYLVDFDSSTTQEHRLTFDGADDHRPALAPDGQTLAFVSDRGGNDEIYLMQIGQLGLQRLTQDRAEDGDPAWSPDGQWLAFRSQRDGNNDLYLMRPDGSDVTRLTDYLGDDLAPAWSPDGSQIAFMSARDGNLELYLMRADGSEVRRLTDHAGVDGYPSWSPDGGQIAFHSDRGGGVDIYLLDLETALRTSGREGSARLSGNPKEDRVPVWHGEFLATMSVVDDDFDIVITDLSGEVIDQFGRAGIFDGFPTWASLTRSP